MNRISRSRAASLLLGTALVLPCAALASDPTPPAEGVIAMAEKIEATGKVTAINPESRLVVIEGEMGKEIFLRVPKDAPNFDQIKVGDGVVAQYQEAIAVAISPVADAEPGVTEGVVVAGAEPGETPGAAAAEMVQLRAVVRAVDVKAGTVTLEGPAGERVFKTDKAVDLSRVKVGEQVSVTHTRALALSLVPKP